jgi:hypothetical protein
MVCPTRYKVHTFQSGLATSDVTFTDICRVLKSIQAGRRLPESRFAPLKLVQETQVSVFGMMNRGNSGKTAHG